MNKVYISVFIIKEAKIILLILSYNKIIFKILTIWKYLIILLVIIWKMKSLSEHEINLIE